MKAGHICPWSLPWQWSDAQAWPWGTQAISTGMHVHLCSSVVSKSGAGFQLFPRQANFFSFNRNSLHLILCLILPRAAHSS